MRRASSSMCHGVPSPFVWTESSRIRVGAMRGHPSPLRIVSRLLIPGPESSSQFIQAGSSMTGIARFREHIGDSPAFGLLFTDRTGTHYYSRVGGADTQPRFSPALVDSLQILRSETRDADTIASTAGRPLGAMTGRASNAPLTIRRGTGWPPRHANGSRRMARSRADTQRWTLVRSLTNGRVYGMRAKSILAGPFNGCTRIAVVCIGVVREV